MHHGPDHVNCLEGGEIMTRARFIVVALIAAAVVALGGATTSSAKPDTAGPPDTYVTAWDAVGTQAFTAAALTPAEGHTIFAYVAIAVYDSVMAIEGGYEPFAVDVDVPRRFAPGSRRGRGAPDPRPLPAGAGATIIDPAYMASLATIPPVRRRRTASASARASPDFSSRSARATASGRR